MALVPKSVAVLETMSNGLDQPALCYFKNLLQILAFKDYEYIKSIICSETCNREFGIYLPACNQHLYFPRV